MTCNRPSRQSLCAENEAAAQALIQAQNMIDEARAEIERLTKERDKAYSEIATLQNQLAEARAQLRHMERFECCTCGPCPIHPDTALEAYGREKVRPLKWKKVYEIESCYFAGNCSWNGCILLSSI